jgi:hypothetical protein
MSLPITDDTPDRLRAPLARVWGDQWLRVSEKILGGLNDELEVRVAALEAEAQRAAKNGGVGRGDALADARRLVHLAELYCCLPEEPSALAEPVQVAEMVARALELHGYHADLRAIPCRLVEPLRTQYVLVRPSALLRSILVLLASAAGHAGRAGGQEPMRIGCTVDGEVVSVTLDSPSPTGDELFAGRGSLLTAVRSALGHARATVDATRRADDVGAAIRFEIRLPVLRERSTELSRDD